MRLYKRTGTNEVKKLKREMEVKTPGLFMGQELLYKLCEIM